MNVIVVFPQLDCCIFILSKNIKLQLVIFITTVAKITLANLSSTGLDNLCRTPYNGRMYRFHAPLPSSKKRSGFTLLELLVVISILGILMAMGAVAFSTAQRKSRDSKRQSDIKVIQNGFEQYYADNGSYASAAQGCNAMYAATYFPAGAPNDPQTAANYDCGTDTGGYCVCATLEDVGTGNASGRTNNTCTFAAGDDLFCVTNLQ